MSKQKIEYWTKAMFRGRNTFIYTKGLAEVIPVSDEDIICDICSSDITVFPVAVAFGSAYCQECEERYLRKGS